MKARHYGADVIVFFLFAGLSYLVLSTSENVPVWDAWHNPELFNLLYSGKLQISDLTADINGHRNFFPRMITLMLGYMSHYDLRWELVINLICGLAIYLIYRKVLQRNHTLSFFAPVIISILVFSLGQYENWYSGWQIACFLTIVMTLLALLLLIFSADRSVNFVLAIGTAFIASYSFASGLLVWPLGLMALIYQKQTWRLILFWLLAGMICITGFVDGLQGASVVHASEIYHYLIYFLAYLGAPIANHNPVLAMIWAIIGLTGVIYLLVVARRDDATVLLVLFCLFSILTGWLISFARLDYGMEYALLSRYTSFSTIYWASLCTLAFRRTSVAKEGFEKNIIWFFIAMIALSSIKTSLASAKEFYIHEKRMQMAITELKKENLETINRNLVKNISWDVDYTLQQAEILKKYRLSLYSD